MTTNVTILNNGPDNVIVDVVGKDDLPVAHEQKLLKPGEFVSQKYVYPGHTLAIAEEVKPPKEAA